MIVRLRYYFDLVSILTRKEIKTRYKNSFFGYLWSLGNPLCFAIIYYLAFKIFMQVPIENYSLFLICGLFPWQWLSVSISNNLYAYTGNAQIIKKTNFPRSTLPLSQVLMEGFNFLLSIPVIIYCLWFYGMNIHLSIALFMPVIMVSQAIMAYGFSLIVSTLNLFFRDIERFVQLGLIMLFYATPILYSPSMVPDDYAYMINYNPFAKLIIVWRELFLTGTINMGYLFDTYLYGVSSVIVGFCIFNRLKHRFAEVL